MHGTYVNPAAALDALAQAERAADDADDADRTEHNPHMLPVSRTLYHLHAAFASGIPRYHCDARRRDLCHY